MILTMELNQFVLFVVHYDMNDQAKRKKWNESIKIMKLL